MSWKDDKDLGPDSFNFTEQQNKWGYVNNPRWTNLPQGVAAREFSENVGGPINPTDKHIPCGHWHKGPIPTPVLSTDAMWQQSLDVLNSKGLLGIGGMSRDSEKEFVLYITDFNGSVKAANLWSVPGPASGFPGTTKIENVNGIPTVFYHVCGIDITEVYNQNWFFKLNINGTYSSHMLSTESYTDDDNYLEYAHLWYLNGMAISSTGVIVTIETVSEISGGVWSYYINTHRSTDWGDTWETAVEIPITDGAIINPYIDCDSNGVFYVIVSDYETPLKPFRLWKSTDDGAAWVEISTVPATPINESYDLAMGISGTKIYIVGQVDDSGDKTYIWYSSDGGATWSRGEPTIAGESYLKDFDITANGDVIVMACAGSTSGNDYIIRSADNGVTWTKIGQRDPALDWPTYIEDYETYISLRNDGGIFVFAACGDYVSGTDYLGYLFSSNNGLTWSVKALSLSRTSDVESLGAPYSSDEPQVWPM